MVNSLLIIASAAALVAGCSGVGPSEADFATHPDLRLQCSDTGYDGFTFRGLTAIPDGDIAGVRIGPLHVIDDGQPIEDVMIGITIMHRYVGDVQLRLLYDEDSDGRPDAASTLEIHRARLDGCSNETLNAYPVELDGTYFFRRDITEAGDAQRFDAFDGLRRGGDFYLAVTDSGSGSAGVVKSWTVYLARAGFDAHVVSAVDD